MPRGSRSRRGGGGGGGGGGSSEDSPDGKPLTAKQRRQLKAQARKGGGHHRAEEDKKQGRHYGGKYERERKQGKQTTCRVCGGPHERRACPGIEDDGTGMSWFKGKGGNKGGRGRGREVDQSGQWAGWKERQSGKRVGRVDPEKFLRRFVKTEAPEAGGAAVVDACANLTEVYDAISLAAVSGGRAGEDEYAVPLEEVCPLQPTFAGCVVNLTSASDWGRRFRLRAATEGGEASSGVGDSDGGNAAAAASVGGEGGGGSAFSFEFLPTCVGVVPRAVELVASAAWAEAATEEFLQALPERLGKALAADAVVACSCGLDYSSDCNTPRALQKRLVAVQMRAAVAAGKPVLLRLRPELRQAAAYDEARLDMLSILQEAMPPTHPFALNAWAGDAETAVKLCRFFPRCYVGLCGVTTFSKAAHMRELCFDVPDDRLLITTDAPHTAAGEVGAAGVPALPSHTPYVAAAVAAQKRTTVPAVLAQAATNARQFFGLPFPIPPGAAAAAATTATAATAAAAAAAATPSGVSVAAIPTAETAAAGTSASSAGGTAATGAQRRGQAGKTAAPATNKRFKCSKCKKKCKAITGAGPCEYCSASFCAKHRAPALHTCAAVPDDEEVEDDDDNDGDGDEREETNGSDGDSHDNDDNDNNDNNNGGGGGCIGDDGAD